MKDRKGTSHEENLIFLEKPKQPPKIKISFGVKAQILSSYKCEPCLAGLVVKFFKDILIRNNYANFFGNKLQK